MTTSRIAWIVAVFLTLALAVYQRLSGPTYPVSGELHVGSTVIPYKLDRSHGGEDDHDVMILTSDTTMKADLWWKRHKVNEAWNRQPMVHREGALHGTLPHQPPAGKLDYLVKVQSPSGEAIIPPAGGVVIRFRGDVPPWILIPHIIAMFAAMLMSARTGLEYFSPTPRLKTFTLWTLGLLCIGGLVLGPIVQKFAFDAYWTGWPFGHDLTDNKTVAAFIVWGIAALMQRRSQQPATWALAAAIVLLIVFLIPHSVLGSELDYTSVPGDPR